MREYLLTYRQSSLSGDRTVTHRYAAVVHRSDPDVLLAASDEAACREACEEAGRINAGLGGRTGDENNDAHVYVREVGAWEEIEHA